MRVTIHTKANVSTTNLRKEGDSVMLTIPPELLDQLRLKVGAPVVVSIEDGRLIIEPKHGPRYTLEELMAMVDPKVLAADKADIWLTSGPLGRELL